MGDRISLSVNLLGYSFEFLDRLMPLIAYAQGDQEVISLPRETIRPAEQGIYEFGIEFASRLKLPANSEVSRQFCGSYCANDGGRPFFPTVKSC
jgi:hypothetical protein